MTPPGGAPLSDADLVERCRTGDEDAWRELVERFSRYVYAIAVQAYRLADHEAEEVFQETFVRAHEHLERLRDDSALRPWLAQLTRRLCVDRLRARGRERPAEEIPDAGDEDVLERLDQALTVRAALERLPDHCREILDRFFARDQSYQTIGSELELPPGTIASRIARCLARLREALREDAPVPARQVDEAP
jgi:RNA polymerase sigma factor (sigma-70 family)